MSLRSLIPVGRARGLGARHDAGPLGTLQSEIDRLFNEFTSGWGNFGAAAQLVPTMDVTETDKEIEITAELPGLEEKDVEINVADNVLTVRGEKKAEKEEKDKNYRLVERSYGSFSRSIELPAGVNTDLIEASLAKGVLKVKVPKPAAADAKKIEVKPAA